MVAQCVYNGAKVSPNYVRRRLTPILARTLFSMAGGVAVGQREEKRSEGARLELGNP